MFYAVTPLVSGAYPQKSGFFDASYTIIYVMRNGRFSWQTLGLGKRLFWVFGIFAVGGLLVITFVPFKKKTGTAVSPKTKEEALASLNRDTDTDGLKDWEEKIYGTDPAKTDTDGDGTPDGEEIKTSRNPLRAGPDDALALPVPFPDTTNTTNAVANELIGKSLTQIIAKSIAGEPLGPELKNPESLKNYIEKLGAINLLSSVIPPETRDFKTSKDNSPASVKKYFNIVTETLARNFNGVESDILILFRAAEQNDITELRLLDKNIAALEQAVKEVKEIPTPTQWTGFAKQETLYLSQTLAAVKILRSTEEDPVTAMLVLKERLAIIDNADALYRETATSLAKAGITFTAQDPASYLLAEK